MDSDSKETWLNPNTLLGHVFLGALVSIGRSFNTLAISGTGDTGIHIEGFLGISQPEHAVIAQTGFKLALEKSNPTSSPALLFISSPSNS